MSILIASELLCSDSVGEFVAPLPTQKSPHMKCDSNEWSREGVSERYSAHWPNFVSIQQLPGFNSFIENTNAINHKNHSTESLCKGYICIECNDNSKRTTLRSSALALIVKHIYWWWQWYEWIADSHATNCASISTFGIVKRLAKRKVNNCIQTERDRERVRISCTVSNWMFINSTCFMRNRCTSP